MEAIFRMILCDTDVLIEFYKNTAHILQELHTIGQQHLAVMPSRKRNCILAH
jgi:hypothetical protein